MATLPIPGAASNANITTAAMKQLIEDVIDKSRGLPGGAAEASITIVAGNITPGSEDSGRSKYAYAVDTEASAATDDLFTIGASNYENGALIKVRCANDARNVVLKHGGGGSGELSLDTGVDFILKSVKQWVIFQLRGATWVEIDRSALVQSGIASVRGLQGQNNGGASTSQFDWTADAVTLRSPSDGSTVTRISPGTITTNTSTSGPAANGRDQSGAFGANNWIHFWYIWNGSTLATLASLSATAPTLPTGYTHLAYITAVRFNASSQLLVGRVRGSSFFYRQAQIAVSGGTATVETSVNVAALVPPNALQYDVTDFGWAVTSDGSGLLIADLEIYVVTGTIFDYMVRPALGGISVGSSSRTASGKSITIPNIGQAFGYRWLITNGSSPSANINVSRYTMPNGDN